MTKRNDSDSSKFRDDSHVTALVVMGLTFFALISHVCTLIARSSIQTLMLNATTASPEKVNFYNNTGYLAAASTQLSINVVCLTLSLVCILRYCFLFQRKLLFYDRVVFIAIPLSVLFALQIFETFYFSEWYNGIQALINVTAYGLFTIFFGSVRLSLMWRYLAAFIFGAFMLIQFVNGATTSNDTEDSHARKRGCLTCCMQTNSSLSTAQARNPRGRNGVI